MLVFIHKLKQSQREQRKKNLELRKKTEKKWIQKKREKCACKHHKMWISGNRSTRNKSTAPCGCLSAFSLNFWRISFSFAWFFFFSDVVFQLRASSLFPPVCFNVPISHLYYIFVTKWISRSKVFVMIFYLLSHFFFPKLQTLNDFTHGCCQMVPWNWIE